MLLDTHCWLWLQVRPERLGAASLARLQEPGVELFLSAASAWEIALKHSVGKLPLSDPPVRYVPERMLSSGVAALSVTHEHALHVATLPLHHVDPFDRLLIAQAQLERLTLLTADRQLAPYDVDLLWAG